MIDSRLEKLKYSIYAIRCTANGRIYIGCTSDVQKRIHQHFLELRKYEKIKTSNVNKTKSGVEWQEDFDKYGEESFESYLLEDNIPYSDKGARENHWILEYGSFDPQKGYNTKVSRPQVYKIIKGLPPKMEGPGVTVDELLTEGGQEEAKTNENM